jgi:2-oxoglutarate dehydrogenase E2 component (dihydrolipoamide succinyltransferase)
MSIELKIPDVGESIQEVQIGRWLKHEGDRVEADENIVELETDKASLELPAPAAGVIRKILKRDGEGAAIGETIAQLDRAGEAESKRAEPEAATKDSSRPESKAAESTADKTAAEKEPKVEERDDADDARRKARRKPEREAEPERPKVREDDRAQTPPVTPSGRRALLEFGLRAEEIPARGDRIRREDVLRTVEERKARAGHVEPHDAMTEEPAARRKESGVKHALERTRADESLEQVVPMSLIRRRIAQRLVEAQHTAALLTTFNEIDMSAVVAMRSEHGERFREKHGIKLGFMSFFLKATIEALKEYPELNAEIRGTDIVYRGYFDIGVAIGSERGLVVPVLRRAERLSFAEIERAIADFATRAAANKLTPDELAGGTFTITNGGVFGSQFSTPIINPPQSGVLGMHAITDRPVVREGQIVVRPMMYVALTYDHRLVDGREAVTFLHRIKEVVEEPARMLIEA